MSEIAVFGAAGRAGRAVVAEALRRGHEVTAIVRDPERYEDRGYTAGDVTDPGDAGKGHDAVVGAVHDPTAEPRTFYTAAAKGLISTNTNRIVMVGLASVLATADGTLLMDTPGYPQAYREFFEGHAAGAGVLRDSGTDWLVISPAGDFDHEGGRTGRYRVAAAEATSRISYADLAVAILDEIEQPTHHRTHIGVES
jgi:putative NADH-flavin reductase